MGKLRVNFTRNERGEAYKWFTLAARFGARQQIIDGRPGLKPKMSQAQIAEAEKRAKDWGEQPHNRMLDVSAQ